MSTLHDESIPRAVQESNQLPMTLTPPPRYEEQAPLPATMLKLGSPSQTKISSIESKEIEEVVVSSVAFNPAVAAALGSATPSSTASPPASLGKPSSASSAASSYKRKNATTPAVPKIPVPASATSGDKTPKIVPKPKSTPTSARTPARTRIGAAASATKETAASKKSSNSGIPLRLKTTNTNIKSGSTPANALATAALKTGGGSYNKQHVANSMPTINKNTLEVQFMNNKKRLMQLHGELVEKQRPLVEMHKCLLRTKKQLEEMGKKVVLEPLKMVTLKEDDPNQHVGSGEAPINEATDNLKSSVEMMIGSFAAMCKKCLDKQDHAVKMLESVSKAEMEVGEVSHGVEILKQEKSDLESILDQTVTENEKKIAELVYSWQQVIKNTNMGEENVGKISELEDKVRLQQKLIADGEENVHHLTRRFEEKKSHMEKSITELSDKIGKLEEDVKKEKKTAAEHVMKTRTLKNKVTEAENRAKESEEKFNDAAAKLRNAQDLLRRKEIQWVKEKDEFKKSEALLQQKFTEKQYHIDARLKNVEEVKQSCENHYASQMKRLEDELEVKEKDIEALEKDREMLTDNVKQLGDELENMRGKIQNLTGKIDELQVVKQQHRTPPDEAKLPYKDGMQATWAEVNENKRKIAESQRKLQDQTQQIIKMQNSLKAHAQLAVALKLEKDSAVKFSNKLRDILQEAKDEIESKNRAIYKIHEKLVLKEADCEKLKAEIKEIVIGADYPTRDRSYPRVRSRCQLMDSPKDCRELYHHVGEPLKYNSPMHCARATVASPKCDVQSQQIVSESLIGMSVKKVDSIRAKLDILKKMRFPVGNKKKRRSNYSWIHTQHSQIRVSSQNSASSPPVGSCENMTCPHLEEQIELRGKLYQILQQHADRSCEDLLELLKKSVSVAGYGGKSGVSLRAAAELKPSRGHGLQGRKRNSSSSNVAPRSASGTVSNCSSCMQFYPNVTKRNDLLEESSLLE